MQAPCPWLGRCPFRELDGQRCTGSNLSISGFIIWHLRPNLYKLSHLCKNINLILMPYQKNHTAYFTQIIRGRENHWAGEMPPQEENACHATLKAWVCISIAHRRKKWGSRVPVHNSSVRETELGGFLGAHWPARLAESLDSRVSERPISEK